jgi:uncharacterized protein (DUF2384 family)
MNAPLPREGNVQEMGKTWLKVVFRILEKWGCSPEQVQAILNISRPSYYNYRQDPGRASLNKDQVERLSYISNIHAHLRTIFDNPKNVYGFMSMPNDNPFFNGRSPLDIISTGHFAALYETAKRIDALRGGQW